MRQYKYTQTDGTETIIASSIPGLSLVLKDLTLADAQPLTAEEYDQHIQKVIEKNKNLKSPIEELTKKLADMQTEIDKLKADKNKADGTTK